MKRNKLHYKAFNVKFTDAADPDDPYKLNDDTRHLGLVVSRGTSIMVICSAEGMEAIANPFLQD